MTTITAAATMDTLPQPKSLATRQAMYVRRAAVFVAVLFAAYLMWPRSEDVSRNVILRRKTVDHNKIALTATELNKVLIYLKRDVRTYLEWTSSGRTSNFPQYVTQRVVSIQHDKEQCKKTQHNVKGTSKAKIEVYCVPVPREAMRWGLKRPFQDDDYRMFRKYIDVMDNLNQSTWDFIFIDGRARVDAAIKALSYIRNDSVVVLHDSWRMRWKYGEVYDYYKVIDETLSIWNQGVAIMRRKPSFAHLQGRSDLTQAILSRKYNI